MDSSVKIIGVAGGSCCGKTTVCKMIIDDLPKGSRVAVLSMEAFYRDVEEANVPNYNFDHPDAFDEALILKTLTDLKARKPVKIPSYDLTRAKRGEGQTVPPADVILFEGILSLYYPEVRALLDMKIFVDLDSDTRLARRVSREMELGRDLDATLSRYTRFVKPAFEDFTLPTKKYADVILPRASENKVAVGLIAQHISSLLKDTPSSATDTPDASPAQRGGRRDRTDSLSRPH
eukprot:m.234452 g.234452  ORF g.234452 m.234452 type:complete len:234 (-) comp19618_c0_seq1:372-1073(-)